MVVNHVHHHHNARQAVSNVCVLVSVAVSYAIFAAPLLAFIEGLLQRRVAIQRPCVLRLCVRPVYVALVTLIAVLVPFFGPIVGLVGAVTFFPMATLVPSMVWAVHTRASLRMKLALGMYNLIGFGLSGAALFGSVVQIALQFTQS